MVFDEYDSRRHGNVEYDKIINVHGHDIIQDVIDKFSMDNHLDVSRITDDFIKIITDTRYMFHVLRHQHITCISARICHDVPPIGEYDVEIGYRLKWYIIHVWR